jgi:putative glutamine amidotransferase
MQSGKILLRWLSPPDGLIEAARMANKRFVCAVQWHPEYMFKTDADSLKVFSWFVAETQKQ